MHFKLTATTMAGLEQVVAHELYALGAINVTVKNRAVIFDADEYLLYAANIYLRTALRILKPVYEFEINSQQELYDRAMQKKWEDYLEIDRTFAIDFAVHSSLFNHTQYAALKLKDAIADYFRNKFGRRPNVDIENPDIKLHLHINENKVTISLDSSGESLHKRGYRKLQHEAPLSEVLAAGMIILSGWDKCSTFFDPMCGSGTLPIEATLIANNMAPGLLRKDYAFKKWNDFNIKLYRNILLEAASQVIEKKIIITGSDIDKKYIEQAKQSAIHANVENKISFFCKPFEIADPPKFKGTVILNPPYGERIKNDDINTFYKIIGDTLKQKYKGYTVWILSSNRDAIKNIGLHPSQKIPLFNGPLECRFLRFDIYEGSRKKNK